MSAPASYARRQFPGAAADTTISGGINNSVTSCSLSSTSGWPTGAYTGGVLCELYSTTTGATAEKVWATDLTGSSLTIVRAADGTSATSHAAGTGIRPVAGAVDADEANKAVAETVGQVTTAGDLLVADGAASMTRLAVGASGRVLISSGSAPTWQALSGDVTVTSGGVVTVANDAITAAKIAADAVGTSEIAADAVTSSEIAADAVGTAEIAADAVTSSEIATDAVGTAEIAANAVTASEIAADAVTTAKILDANVTGAKIANDAIDSQHYADGSIDTAHIADDQVTLDKLAASAKPRWHVGPFLEDNTTAGASATSMGYGADFAATSPSTAVMMEAGSIIGVSVSCKSARTAGTLTVEVYKNNVATGLTVTLDGTNTTNHYTVQAEGLDTFVAGDTVGCYWSTSGAWAAFASDGIAATVLCAGT